MLLSISGGHQHQAGGNPSGGKMASRDLPREEEEGREVLSIEEEPGSQAYQSFEEVLFG